MRKCAPVSLILRTEAFESIIASLIAGLDVRTFEKVTLALFKTAYCFIKVLLKLLILDFLDLFNLLKFCSTFRGTWAIFMSVSLSLRHSHLLFWLLFTNWMMLNRYCPLLAGDVIFFEFFTNFLIKVTARTFTKIIEIIDVKRGSLTYYRLSRFNNLRVCDRRGSLDAQKRINVWSFIHAQRLIDLGNVIVDLTLSLELRDLAIIWLIHWLHLNERLQRFLFFKEIADLI